MDASKFVFLYMCILACILVCRVRLCVCACALACVHLRVRYMYEVKDFVCISLVFEELQQFLGSLLTTHGIEGATAVEDEDTQSWTVSDN